MDCYIYCADTYCADCGEKIREELTHEGRAPADPNNEHSYDSDEFPKGPYADGGGESDCPQHCGAGAECINAITWPDGSKAGAWLENELTSDGVKHVREALIEGGEVAEFWASEYRKMGYDIPALPRAAGVLDGEQLFAPAEIAPNLAAGVSVGGGWITVTYSDSQGTDGRTRYRWEVIFPDGSDMHGDDLQSGCGGGTMMEGLESLLSFLGAAGESRKYREQDGETEIDEDSNETLFPAKVVEFAAQNSDEISMCQLEIEEAFQEIRKLRK